MPFSSGNWRPSRNAACPKHFFSTPSFASSNFFPPCTPLKMKEFYSPSRPPDYWESLKAQKVCPPQALALSDPSFTGFKEIESWGPSLLIAAFAKKHRLAYYMPNRKLSGRSIQNGFPSSAAQNFPEQRLLHNEKPGQTMAQLIRREESLKTCYSVPGKGHLLIDGPASRQFPSGTFRALFKKEYQNGSPVIAEPWVQRNLDFSTQWHIDNNKHISYIGATLCANDEKGQYCYNQVGDEKQLFGDHLPFLNEHLKIAEPILLKIAQLGFFGNVRHRCHAVHVIRRYRRTYTPIVEINARKTMDGHPLRSTKISSRSHSAFQLFGRS